jgi:hypothetical protein
LPEAPQILGAPSSAQFIAPKVGNRAKRDPSSTSPKAIFTEIERKFPLAVDNPVRNGKMCDVAYTPF